MYIVTMRERESVSKFVRKWK